MFSKAYELSSKFTQLLIIAFRFFDKTVESGLGSFIILNKEGWIMTAAHNLEVSFAFNQHQLDISDFYEKREKINSNKNI